MRPIIRAERLGKQYRVGRREAAYGTLRDVLAGAFAAPLRRVRGGAGGAAGRGETVWALKDVSFDVGPGETVGLIGRNGAGKSTLLKILSRITEPTVGRAELYGRIGSLLEVGTGFHPELTGRENVFLNGAVLGMSRAEIERKFDEIVAFSEIERFIDTPVKWYSSGMYLRLAFSVAAHLEPEILVLDEVLSVGDADFQIKCINKMQELRTQGRTLLFVSHDVQAITRLCHRAIYLSGGTVVDDGPAHEVTRAYLSSRLVTAGERTWPDPGGAPGDARARLLAVRVRAEGGEVTDLIDIRRPVGVEMEFEMLEPGLRVGPNLHFFNEQGVHMFLTADQDPEWARRPRPAGRYVSTAWVPGNFLAEGTVLVSAALTRHEPTEVLFHVPEAVAFQVVDGMEGDSLRGDYVGPFPGVVRPRLPWTTRYLPPAAAAQTSNVEGGVRL
jgi:lipopolysaccharide transport system ATP-binding protein